MGAKEKAVELRDKFADVIRHFPESECMNYDEEGVICALNHVDLLLITISGLEDSVWAENMKSFYEEVRTELENL